MDAARRNRDQVIAWAQQGMSQTEIAHRVGTNRRYVRRLLIEEDIALPRQKLAGKHNPHWKGGRMTDKQGYILVKMRGHHLANRHGYVREHRLIAEDMLGRALRPGEVVHHIDGNPANNDPDNLSVYQTNASHLKHELMGRVPCWTEDGKRRIREGVARSVANRRDASRASSKLRAGPPPRTPLHQM